MPDLETGDVQARIDIRGGLPAGSTLGGYELKSILGKGAFGITYRALNLALVQQVAIKEYLPTAVALREGRTTVLPISTDHAEQFAWGRSRFLEEANTLKRLNGTPSIVGVHDFFEANGTAYMVMELIEGETLAKQLVREERLGAGLVEPLLFPLLDGLAKVHAAGFLHRDIKPANIMIEAAGKPTLIDFGASRAALAGRTTTFTAIFTPGYAAVEQFASNKLGPSADIYGLAATLYHAMTGHPPPSAIERVLKDEYQPLVELQPAGYSMAFLESIDVALAVSAADRPQSVGEWRRMLTSSLEATRIAKSPGRLARAASRTRRARLSLGAPAVGLVSAVGVALLALTGYSVFTSNVPVPPTVTTAALLSTQQLEQALAERRKADAQAADMARREDEARQKVQAEAEAKRQADQALEQARQARLRAQQELAELNTRLEAQRRDNADQASRAAGEAAQRKAEQEAAALAEAEQRAAQKAAADAEAKHQADEALAKAEADRQLAEQEARQKAEVEQAALRQAPEDAQRKAAEAESVKQAEQERLKAEAEREKAQAERQKAEAEGKAKAEAEVSEKALRLEQADRQRLQVALSSLGFDTRGSDGMFGPRSRDMIAGWQRKAGVPPTGFLTAAQRDQLLRAGAPAVARWDEEQKKGEEQKKKSDPTPAVSALPASSSSGAGVSGAGASSPIRDGTYGGGLGIYARALGLELRMSNGSGTGIVTSSTCGTGPMSLTVENTGTVTGQMKVLSGGSCSWTSARITGRVDDGKLLLAVEGDHIGYQPRGQATLILGGTFQVAAAGPPASQSPDGLWRGTYSCGGVVGSFGSEAEGQAFTIQLEMQIANGSGVWKNSSSSSASGGSVEVKLSMAPSGVSVERTFYSKFALSRGRIDGQYDGNTIRATGRELPGNRECTLALTRAGER